MQIILRSCMMPGGPPQKRMTELEKGLWHIKCAQFMAIICRLRDKTSFSYNFQYTITCWMSGDFHIQTHFCSPSLYFVYCTKLERKSNTIPQSLWLFKQSKSNQTNSWIGNEQEGVKMKKNGLTLKILISSAKVWLGKWKVWLLQSKHVS